MANNGPLSFGQFRLDPATLELWHDGVRIPIEPLPARILARLAMRAGAMVSRRELLELGWPRLPDAAEQSLNTCIHQIRQALNHGGAAGVELETLRGRGYRLTVHAVRELTIAPARAWALRLAGATLALAVLLIAGALLARRASDGLLPDDVAHALDRARYLVEETGDAAAARAVLDSALQRFPRVAALHAEQAEVSLWLGDADAARQSAATALSVGPAVAATHRARAALALLRSDWKEADAEYARALRIDPNDARTLMALAFRRVIEGAFEDADQLVRTARRIDPLSTAVQQDGGMVYLLAGRFADAEEYCRETLRFKPRSLWATDCMFDLMVLTRRVEDGAHWGRRLLELYNAEPPAAAAPPADVVAATEAWRLDAWQRAVRRGAHPFGLALAFAANGRTDDAVEALEAAAETPTLGLLSIAVDPRLARLHGHDDFEKLLEILKLRG